MNFEVIVNEKISLRLRDASDAEAQFILTDKNRTHLAPWFPWVEKTIGVEDSEKFILKCMKGFEEKTDLDLGVYFEDVLVGSMGFHTIDKKNEWGEIGYWISKDYEGKGIMTQCVRRLVEYGFGELSLHRIQIRCDSRNEKSKRIPEKLSFTLEATIRESKKHDDGYSDGLIFGLLQSEWRISSYLK